MIGSELVSNGTCSGLVGTPEMIKKRIQVISETGIDHLLLWFSQTVNDLDIFTNILTI
jgi:hypothetical protein